MASATSNGATAVSLPLLYIFWHYTKALKSFWYLYRTLLWFVYHFFSLPLLLRTFFVPWRRLKEQTYGHPLEDFIANTALRFVGVFMRSLTIALGTASLLISAVLGLLAFVLWLLLPVMIPATLIFGLISLTL